MSFGAKVHPSARLKKPHVHVHGVGSGTPGGIGPGPFSSAVPAASGGFPAASADPQLASTNGPDADQTEEA
jgi:hypothetical protein